MRPNADQLLTTRPAARRTLPLHALLRLCWSATLLLPRRLLKLIQAHSFELKGRHMYRPNGKVALAGAATRGIGSRRDRNPEVRQAERSGEQDGTRLPHDHGGKSKSMMRRELVCVEPAAPVRLEVRTREAPRPRAGEVLVRVEATSVNPIDVRRAEGYGRRLLGLKGAATFPLVLGNDVVGKVVAVGTGVTRFGPGQSVYGLVATGKEGGAHASHVVVPEGQLRPAPDGADPKALAVLPYSFTTMWLAVCSTGLAPTNAAGKRVLVNGASGGLGRLALQTLCAWGSHVTAICGRGERQDCLALGAVDVIERGPGRIASLNSDFDVVLNFGSWDDDLLLASRLGARALGHATTVHPLLASFDRLGWLQGALAARRQWKEVRSAVARRAREARYSWTLFKPDREALDALDAKLRHGGFSLPLGICAPFEHAGKAFAHVATGGTGRAVLLP
ncbi:MAG: alcohol dehydrogenase catalytic domain-containing protein [Burkholderiales bacterium]